MKESKISEIHSTWWVKLSKMLCAKCGIIQFMYIETHKKIKKDFQINNYVVKQILWAGEPVILG